MRFNYIESNCGFHFYELADVAAACGHTLHLLVDALDLGGPLLLLLLLLLVLFVGMLGVHCGRRLQHFLQVVSLQLTCDRVFFNEGLFVKSVVHADRYKLVLKANTLLGTFENSIAVLIALLVAVFDSAVVNILLRAGSF